MKITTTTIDRTTNATNTEFTESADELFLALAVDGADALGEECADARSLEYVLQAGCCPTCLAFDGAALPGDEGLAVALCPTCGIASVEAALVLDIEAQIATLAGLAALDAAI